jgi:hypothetical protein
MKGASTPFNPNADNGHTADCRVPRPNTRPPHPGDPRGQVFVFGAIGFRVGYQKLGRAPHPQSLAPPTRPIPHSKTNIKTGTFNAVYRFGNEAGQMIGKLHIFSVCA